jgi:hypothetical protein
MCEFLCQAEVHVYKRYSVNKWYILCAWCKQQVQLNTDAEWLPLNQVDQKILEALEISHGICSECFYKFFPDIAASEEDLD